MMCFSKVQEKNSVLCASIDLNEFLELYDIRAECDDLIISHEGGGGVCVCVCVPCSLCVHLYLSSNIYLQFMYSLYAEVPSYFHNLCTYE